MKQFIALTCLAILIAACQKEQVTTNDGSIVALAGDNRQSNRVITCTGCDGNGQNCAECSCDGSGGNCLPDVVVTPAHLTAMNNVISAIWTGVQSTIRAAFSSNSTMLSNYLAVSDVNAVLNGTATATTERGSRNARFIIIRDLQGRITAAYPLY